MAEIKSTLEIALERAAALGGRDTAEEDRREAAQKGMVGARKVLSGDVAPKDIRSELSGLDDEYRTVAVREAARLLLEPLPGQRDLALESLSALVAAEGEQRERLLHLEKTLDKLHRATLDLSRELAAELKEQLAARGFGGPALKANPETHPEFEQRAQAALAGRLSALEEAKAGLLQSI